VASVLRVVESIVYATVAGVATPLLVGFFKKKKKQRLLLL
jgi:hypothetical protein